MNGRTGGGVVEEVEEVEGVEEEEVAMAVRRRREIHHCHLDSSPLLFLFTHVMTVKCYMRRCCHFILMLYVFTHS